MDIFDTKPGTDLDPWSGQKSARQGKRLNCDNCGIEFYRPPSQCRGATRSCSPECASELRKVRVKVNCAICSAEFELVPNRVGMIVTCSEKCRKLRRAYDVIKNAPRFDGGLTLAQFCKNAGITRNQARYRQRTGQELGAKLTKGRRPKT